MGYVFGTYHCRKCFIFKILHITDSSAVVKSYIVAIEAVLKLETNWKTVNVLYCSIAEFNTLYHPDLRQDVFIKDEFHYLNVPRVGTYIVHDTFDCTFECLNNPSCLSLNLAASKRVDGKLWCELLSSQKYSKPEEYKGNDTSHHYSIKVRKAFHRRR